MDLSLIENLIELISKSDVDEVAIEEGEFSIKIKKKSEQVAAPAPQTVHVPQASAPAPQQPAPQAASQQSEGGSSEAAADEPTGNQVTIKSPIVGTYYEAPSPDDDAYINVGDTISEGDTLCIVEAMKIMNEIESEHKGKIVKILVDDGQPVEYDQPLFIIDPA